MVLKLLKDLLEVMWQGASSEQGLQFGGSSFDEQQGWAERCSVLHCYDARHHMGRLKAEALQHFKCRKCHLPMRAIAFQRKCYLITLLQIVTAHCDAAAQL